MATVERRVSVIEHDLREIAYAQRKNEVFLETFSQEMKEFKDEMLEFKNEMKDFKGEMLEFKNEMKDFKTEMLEFKEEMKDFKDEMRRSKREMDQKWGELANKLGTVVEDIIAPGFSGVLRRYFETEADAVFVRARKRHPEDRSRVREFDIIALENNRVFLNETKSNPRMEYAREFVASYNELFEYFPEYRGRELVPIFSSLNLPDEVVQYLSENGCYAMALGEDHLEILNFNAVNPR